MFNDMIKKLKGQNKKIVFTEGEEFLSWQKKTN